jgi:glycosyltransferase domain-containing protein
MKEAISLLIPTHNRHAYLRRALAYYGPAAFRTYVADSTPEPYKQVEDENLTYFHLPGLSLTGKIAYALEQVQTPYIVMCADDDFLIPERILDCIQFLESRPDYVAACGNSICYKKNSLASGKVVFAAMYTHRLSYEVSAKDPFERIRQFFTPYRGGFYAVHRTAILRKAFENADTAIKNLFLNEYLTALYPLAMGAFAELPFLFHIREYADDSGDKTTMNLDGIFYDAAFRAEYDSFLTHQAAIIALTTGTDTAYCKTQLHDVLHKYAKGMQEGRYAAVPGPEKKIGSLVKYVPVLGNKIIQAYRAYRTQKALAPFIRSAEDKAILQRVGQLILEYRGINN